MRQMMWISGILMSMSATAAPFKDLTLDQAMERPGLLVVELSKANACQGDEDGWADKNVSQWFAEKKATAVSLPRTADHLDRLIGEGYRSGVLRIAFQDGEEIDRVCGCMGPPAMNTWLSAVAEGKTSADLLRAELDADTSRDLPAGRYLEEVNLHRCAGRLDKAFSTLAWLWSVLPDKRPDLRPLRLSRVAHDMGVVAREHPPAKEALAGMRDALNDSKDTDRAALDDWMALNRILSDDDLTIAWFERPGSDAARLDLLSQVAPNLFYMYAERGRWADAGRLIDDVDAWLSVWKQQTGGLDTAVWGYAALLRVGDAKAAAKLAKGILKVSDEGTACSLLAKSTEVGATDKAQKALSKDCQDAAVVDAWSASLSP